MNLTGQTVYVKGSIPKRSNDPTPAQRKRWERIRKLGCSVCGACPEIHHCGSGGGGRRDHDKVIPLCTHHHTGAQGIHKLSRRIWSDIYGSEDYHMAKVARMLGEPDPLAPGSASGAGFI